MNLFFLIAFGLYFIIVLLLIAGWSAQHTSPGKQHRFATITVVVPFRNEMVHIDKLIADLSQVNYPGEFEVILVNDHSTDQSGEMMVSLVAARNNFSMISLPDGKDGKKQAISAAIERATGEIIVTTDADCRVPVDWLLLVNECFHNEKLKMVIGGVKIEEEKSIFSRLQSLEFSSLVGVTGATARFGIPVTANGANLAFLKSAFVEVNGYDGNFSIPSGDDEFLLRKFSSRFAGSIHFMAHPGSVVTTYPQKTLRDFLHQRLRWAGKWKYNTSVFPKILAVLVLTFQVSFVTLPVLAMTQRIDPELAIVMVTSKLLLESFFLFRVCSFLDVKFRLLHFLLLQFLYPPYVIYVGFASFFMPYVWKERLH